jgi:hypothetical protein
MRFAAVSAVSRSEVCTTIAFAPVSLSWYFNSSAVYAGLAGETTPPAQWHPQNNVEASMSFGAKSKRISPLCHSHWIWRLAPKLRDWDRMLLKVRTSPDGDLKMTMLVSIRI